MKRRNFWYFVFAAFFLVSSCGEKESGITTFILIRHAEKGDDGTQDPDLKAEGNARAEKLASMLKDTHLAAIYSTNYKRTKNTVKLIAQMKDLEIQTYEAHNPEVIEKMIEQHRGEIVLVSGHTNTTPWTANLLLGKEMYDEYDESEYGIILIVGVAEMGTGTVTRMNY